MARFIRSGSPHCCEPLISYVLEDNDIIVSKRDLCNFLWTHGFDNTQIDEFIHSINTQPKVEPLQP